MGTFIDFVGLLKLNNATIGHQSSPPPLDCVGELYEFFVLKASNVRNKVPKKDRFVAGAHSSIATHQKRQSFKLLN